MIYFSRGVNVKNHIPEKPKVNYWMVSAVPVLIMLVTVGAWFILNAKNKASQVMSAAYDENCNIKITLSTKEVISIPTEHKKSGVTICHQVKWISISPDKKYVAFEGSDWSLPQGSNYLGVYFSAQRDFANVWQIGAASLSHLSFDNADNLIAEGTYAGDQSTTQLKFRLNYIEQNFKTLVNPTTKRLPEANQAWTTL
jgi:hypothetical protein